VPTIDLRLHAGLERYASQVRAGAAFAVALRDGATVGDVLRHLAIPAEAVQLVFVNGLARSLDSPLEDGDRVALFAPVGGG
jgi:molybdopterin synthase sulfur carrier subunit